MHHSDCLKPNIIVTLPVWFHDTYNLLDDRDTLCLILLTEQINVTQLAKVESCSVSRPWSVTSNSWSWGTWGGNGEQCRGLTW